MPETFIVKEEERLVMHNRSPECGAELIAAEGRDRRPIEVISGIERAVAEELIPAPVEGIAAGPSDGIDDAP